MDSIRATAVMEGSRRPEEARLFRRRLEGVAGKVRGLGLRGLDAYALALDLLYPAKSPSRPKGTSRRDLQRTIRDRFRSEERRHRREGNVAAREAPEGVWRAPATDAESGEVREALRRVLRDAAKGLRRVDRSAFAGRVLARFEGEPVPGPAGATRLDRRIRDALVEGLLREGVEVTDLGACPGAGSILLEALQLWAGEGNRSRSGSAGAPDARHRERRGMPIGGLSL